MVMALMLTTSMTAFAATGSRTYKAASKMTITLNPGQRGNSNTVTIRVSDLPEDAIITKLTVNTGSMTYSGGAIVCNYLTISSSNGRTEQIAWTGQANKMILSILVDTFISKISFPMQPGPEIGSISDA